MSQLFLAVLDRSQFLVTVFVAGFILYTRSAAAAYFGAGAVGAAAFAKVLKKIIQEPRPPHSERRGVTYGLPSTHSSVSGYLATTVTLSCIYLPIHHSLQHVPSFIIRTITPIIITPGASIVAVSRIWLGHHTFKQVAAGCLCGVIFGYAWFSAWVKGVNEYAEPLEEFVNNLIPWPW